MSEAMTAESLESGYGTFTLVVEPVAIFSSLLQRFAYRLVGSDK